MEDRVLNEATIREYLLGRLGDDPELVERMDEQILTDTEFSENVDVIEDEIIEEYLEGTLNSNDTQAVEGHFLRPPERRRKLRNARLLGHHFATTAVSSESQRAQVDVHRSVGFWAPLRSLTHFRIYVEVTAMALLIVSTIYLVQLRRDLKIEVRLSAQKLAQERERSASLNHRLDAALELAEPPTVMLSLLQPGVRRGDSQLPELMIGAGTKMVHAEIALPSVASGTYSVQLEIDEKTVWSQNRVEVLTARDGAILMFDLPTQVLAQGECKFVLKQGSGPEISYWFLVSKLR